MRKRHFRVLIISTAYGSGGGGIATHVDYLANALSRLQLRKVDPRRVCDVLVLTIGQPSLPEKNRIEGTPPGLTVHRVPWETEEQGSGIGSAGHVPCEAAIGYCMKHWREFKPDIIHAHDFDSMQVAILLKAAFHVPIVVTVHKTPKKWEPSLPQREVKDCYLEVLRQLAVVNRFVAPCNAYRARLLDQGFQYEEIEVIKHGVPFGRLLRTHNEPSALKRLGLEDSDELILCPSRLDPHKGLETFVEAAELLLRRFSGRKLVFVVAGSGSGEYRSKLLQRAAPIATHMRFGSSDGKDFNHAEMPTLYRRAKICVLPSTQEGFPQALLEAFVFRKPVVASNTGGIPEMVQADVTGLLCHRNDPSDLARQIEQLLRDSSHAEILAEGAYNRVKREFHAVRMAEEYYSLYKRLAAEFKRKAAGSFESPST